MRVKNQNERAGQISQDAARRLLEAAEAVTGFPWDDLRVMVRVIGATTDAAEDYMRRIDESERRMKVLEAAIDKARGKGETDAS